MQRFSAVPSRAISDPDLTDSEFRTLAAIATYADKDGWCYPSQSTLADLRGVSRKTINNHVKKLTESGYINTHARYTENGAQTSNMMQVRLDFPPDESPEVTPPVTPRGYTPCNTKDVTPPVTPGGYTNTPINTTEEHSSGGAFSAYENTFGPIHNLKQSQLVQDDIDTYGETAVIEAINAAKERNVKSYRWVSARLSGRRQDAQRQSTGETIWAEIEKYMHRSKQWPELTPQTQTIIKRVGGQSRLQSVKVGFETDQLKREVLSYAAA